MRFRAVVFAMLLAGGLAIGGDVRARGGQDEIRAFSPDLAALNDELRAAGPLNVALDQVEILVSPGYEGATTIFANDRTHLLTTQFVEDDPRRGSPANTITYLVDRSDGAALSWPTPTPGPPPVVLLNAVTEPELDASMAVWGAMNCNGPAMAKVADPGDDPDVIDGLVLKNAALIGTPLADITHAGWLPGSFFNAAVPPNGGTYILGATFTFIFVDSAGDPTDVDGDGRADVAFREIFYNRAFPWGTGSNPRNVDIQSVGIHESGHALGLGHFGKMFQTDSGRLLFAPKAIMNAAYVGEDREIRGTDNASFCHIWANSH